MASQDHIGTFLGRVWGKKIRRKGVTDMVYMSTIFANFSLH